MAVFFPCASQIPVQKPGKPLLFNTDNTTLVRLIIQLHRSDLIYGHLMSAYNSALTQRERLAVKLIKRCTFSQSAHISSPSYGETWICGEGKYESLNMWNLQRVPEMAGTCNMVVAPLASSLISCSTLSETAPFITNTCHSHCRSVAALVHLSQVMGDYIWLIKSMSWIYLY